MKNIMKRAWEIYRTLTGDRLAKLSQALKMAWAEIKNVVKEKFNRYATIAKSAHGTNYDDGSTVTNFKLWENYGKKRVYVTNYKGRTLAYIDCDNNNNIVTISDNETVCAAVIEIIKEFLGKYEI